MAPGARAVGLLAVLALIVVAIVEGARYQVVQAVEDRLATNYTIGDAQFSAPGLLVWPRLTQSDAIANCDVCNSTGFSRSGITAQYGVLSSDPGMDVFLSGELGIAIEPRDVQLPQVAWILQWPLPDVCLGYAAEPHHEKCSSYELIDDATGWILDVGQDLTH